VSRAVARVSRASAGRRPVDVVPGFIADADFGRRQPRPDFVPRKPYALFVGTLGREKGVHVLLDAHRRLDGSIPLVLAGPRRPDTPRGARAGVTFLPPLSHDHVMAACQHARVVVMPSVAPEGFGLVAVEAMASGVPVIATRNAGLLDIVVDGETGLLVLPGDSAGLAQALQRLWQDDDLHRAMSAAAANRAERFRASAVVQRIEAIYGELR
jgi:glycosyltransferase involved in cell wall biosynthesis